MIEHGHEVPFPDSLGTDSSRSDSLMAEVPFADLSVPDYFPELLWPDLFGQRDMDSESCGW